MIVKLYLLMMLSVCTWQDIGSKTINLWLVLSGIILSFLYSLVYCSNEPADILAGAGIGLIICALSIITQGAIGFADGLMFIFTGIIIGLWPNIVLFFMALVLGAGYSAYLLIAEKKNRRYEFAFVPFMLVAYVVMLALDGEML